ncbi:MAG: branched-chain amino acid aminotransferase, partial [Clostridiales bacterium]|nr:branched-chain amino acid aminotransferase [Clostridiales bacterium]
MIPIERTATPKQKPAAAPVFGTVFTDHMFVAEYENGAWGKARIQPYRPFALDPATSVFHYGQAVFEGLKAYKSADGAVRLFRYRDNIARLDESAERICMPKVPHELFEEGLLTLIETERDWIPSAPGTSLYIRPCLIASDTRLAVHACNRCIFFIIASPVGAYYARGLSPVKLLAETTYSRAAKGGTGGVKFAGNYAASLLAAHKAEAQGYDQIMWLDAATKTIAEEVGSMNIFFVEDGRVLTPALSGSILPGITRRSVLQLLRHEGVACEEGAISVDRIVAGIKKGTLTEVFGTGTA